MVGMQPRFRQVPPILSRSIKTTSAPSWLKRMAQEGELTRDGIYQVMGETKPNQKERIRLDREELGRFFPQSYTDSQIKQDIFKGLELLKRQRERDRGR